MYFSSNSPQPHTHLLGSQILLFSCIRKISELKIYIKKCALTLTLWILMTCEEVTLIRRFDFERMENTLCLITLAKHAENSWKLSNQFYSFSHCVRAVDLHFRQCFSSFILRVGGCHSRFSARKRNIWTVCVLIAFHQCKSCVISRTHAEDQTRDDSRRQANRKNICAIFNGMI